MKQFIEPLDKFYKNPIKIISYVFFMYYLFLSVIFDYQDFMAHMVWYSENMEEKLLTFIRRLNNMQFAADSDIYMMKFWCL